MRRCKKKDAPCSSSRVMDPSCLFTTDDGESETKIRRTEQPVTTKCRCFVRPERRWGQKAQTL